MIDDASYGALVDSSHLDSHERDENPDERATSNTTNRDPEPLSHYDMVL